MIFIVSLRIQKQHIRSYVRFFIYKWQQPEVSILKFQCVFHNSYTRIADRSRRNIQPGAVGGFGLGLAAWDCHIRYLSNMF